MQKSKSNLNIVLKECGPVAKFLAKKRKFCESYQEELKKVHKRLPNIELMLTICIINSVLYESQRNQD